MGNNYYETTKILSHNIVWLRTHYEFSKERMAEILNISVDVLNKIENGEIGDDLTVEAFINAANFFCVETKDLFGKYLPLKY